MVLDPELQEQARQLFVEEALELLQQVQEDIFELAEQPTSSQIKKLLEDVRFILDGAIEVELLELQIPVERLERMLLSLQRSPGKLEPDRTELLQIAYQDIWSALLPYLPTYPAEPHTRIVEIASPTTESLQLDPIEASVRVDFPAALERLAKILSEFKGDLLVNELKATAELFLNMGETLQSSESIAIAETTLATLQTNPEFAQAIGKSALIDWRRVYQKAIAQRENSTNLNPSSVPEEREERKIADDFSSKPISPTKPPPVREQTLSTVKYWLWLSGFNLFILPVDSIEEIVNLSSEQTIESDNQLFLLWQQKQIEFYRISQLLNYNCFLGNRDPTTKQQLNFPRESLQIPIVNLGGNAIALEPEVERFIVKSKLVLIPFGDAIVAPNYLRGCTLLEDGLLVPVIDVKALLRFHLQTSQDLARSTSLKNEKTLAAPTILVIDDSKTMREILSLALEREGYQVIRAEDGRSAIAQLEKNPQVRAIVCDLEMPEINGFDFLKYRSQHPAIARLPTIMLTTHNSNEYRQLALELGASDYFTIPYSETEFFTLLKLRLE
jgi:CheY-like chemotaxis protein